MARFNEMLVGRYSSFIQKLFSMKGAAAVPQVASEVQPVFTFFNGRENRYLEGWQSYAFTRAAVAVAAIQSGQRIRNPVGSNIVAVFEKITYASPLADLATLRYAVTNTDLPTVFVVGLKGLDPRGPRDSALITSENSGGGGVLLQARMLIKSPNNLSVDFIITDSTELTLFPGDAIEVISQTVNQAIDGITWLWRERFLEDSERR
jgi:hypothetical protein